MSATDGSARRPPQAVSQDQMIETCYSFIPKRVGSDLSFVYFDAEITPAIFGDVLQFCAIVMRVKFPLRKFISWNTKDTSCLDLLALDAAYLHITAFSARAFIDKILGQPNHATS
ncbi:hypothetical protein NA56DRAFT_685117 [Hyaloscypha hepaticicola]|uniref:Uncharacterized protein n=1 Tax=Hyaloscypha hepaticicola TaxID=2082293 RepID=A0A2J6QKQ9_9HELO|nr:hypothetical protein NA56DRAFT_685117 [Hyaloscypha hepaticicola]